MLCLNMLAFLAIILKHVVGRSTAGLFYFGHYLLMPMKHLRVVFFNTISVNDICKDLFLQHDVPNMQLDFCVLLSAT